MIQNTYLRTVLLAGLAVLIIGFTAAAPVAAASEDPTTTTTEEPSDDEESEDTIINIDLDEVTDAINGLDDQFKDALFAVLFKPFRTAAQLLVKSLVVVLTNTPSVYPNPAVEEIHRTTLLVTYMLSGLGFMAAGLLYIVGPILGVSYGQVRMILPRMIAALVFGSVSLPLLQYGVELSDALVIAFMPSGLSMSIPELVGLGAGVALAAVVNAWLLLAVVVLFIVRAVYIMFVAAISPLLALMWSLPKARRYADTFIGGWFAALLMAPLDVLALRFSMALMQGNGSTAFQGLSNWVLGVASLVLLLWIPRQLYGASQAAVGQAYAVTSSVKNRVRHHRTQEYRDGMLNSKQEKTDFSAQEKQRIRENERRRRKGSSGLYDGQWSDDDD
jgi:hypothetical protein